MAKKRKSAKAKAARRRIPAANIDDDIPYVKSENGELVPYVGDVYVRDDNGKLVPYANPAPRPFTARDHERANRTRPSYPRLSGGRGLLDIAECRVIVTKEQFQAYLAYV